MKLITREQGAEIHGVSIWTFRHYVKKGLIKKNITDKPSRSHRILLWNSDDVIAGLETVKAHKEERKREGLSKRGPKSIKFQTEFWAVEIELDPFNVYLHRHVQATPTAIRS